MVSFYKSREKGDKTNYDKKNAPASLREQSAPYSRLMLRPNGNTAQKSNTIKTINDYRINLMKHYYFLFCNKSFSSFDSRRSTFFTSSAGGRFSGTIPRSISIWRTAALLSTCSFVIETSPCKSFA